MNLFFNSFADEMVKLAKLPHGSADEASKAKTKKKEQQDDELRRWVMAIRDAAEQKLKETASPAGRRRAMQRRMMWGS